MLYLVGQILLCLLVAAAIGFAAGWLARGIGERSRFQALEGTWRSRVRAVELERAELERQIEDRDESAPAEADEAEDEPEREG